MTDMTEGVNLMMTIHTIFRMATFKGDEDGREADLLQRQLYDAIIDVVFAEKLKTANEFRRKRGQPEVTA